VSDSGYTEPSGGSGNQVTIAVVTGTPTSSASLANLLGVGSQPASSLLLGYVLVPAAATNIITADIANVATQAQLGLMPTTGLSQGTAINISASQATSSTSFTTLTTPDEVTVVLPANGLIAMWYQATWQSSVAAAGAAAIFLGGTQVEIASNNNAPGVAYTTTTGAGATAQSLFSTSTGLATAAQSGYTGDVATGQIVGDNQYSGGPCYIFAAAGTYAVSVQFKASSGSVTANARKMWVQAIPFI
jgi:ethanolamine utilization microcompartment shell protein EutS